MPQALRNCLLSALPPPVLDAIVAECVPHTLSLGVIEHEQDTPLEYVQFPESGVISVLTVMADGLAVETAVVGREGIVGYPLGRDDIAPWRAVVQLPGSSLRLPVSALRRHLAESSELRELLEGYSSMLLAMSAQSSACNRFHSLSARLARWLLITHDRAESDEFSATQEFLAQMLGAHRPSVTTAARQLQDDSVIDYRRGRIRVLDRAGLVRAACECYERIRRFQHGVFVPE